MLIAWQSGICATQIPSQKDIPTHFEDSYVELSLPHPILIIFGKFIGRNEFWDSGTQGPVEYIVLQRCNHAPQKERRIREEERRKTRFLVHWEGMKFVKVYPNNPLRFETTKCSKQRVEQSSARTLFPKCVHKLGSPRFFLEAVFLNNGYCRSCSESSSGSCSFFKWFSFFPIHEMSVVAR